MHPVEKRPYVTPQLIVYGRVAELTAAKRPGSRDKNGGPPLSSLKGPTSKDALGGKK